MKSIKPGRGPSFMNGISSLLVALFGVLWTVVVARAGGGLVALFGVIFIVQAVVQAVYNFKNAGQKNRYSTFDITETGEEPDPLNERFENLPSEADKDVESKFCPYCGTAVEEAYQYCHNCGKKLP